MLKNKNRKAVSLTVDLFNCIVPVKVETWKGKPCYCAIICLPKEQDLLKGNEPIEPYKDDEYQELRKEVRAAHKTLLKKLKRKRKSDKQSGKVNHLVVLFL